MLITIPMENLMSYNLNVKAFFFNAKTDYLPYYKNFAMSLSEESVAKDIVEEIQAQNENFAFPQLNLIFKINDLVVDEETTVSAIVGRLGSDLKIDPVNTYRSNNGLIINNDDFMKSFELLAPYASEEDKAYYKTLYALHYASETENFDRDYIGDAILVLAHKMITEGSEYKKEILHAITSAHSGLLDCEYENNLFDAQDHTQTIALLKAMISLNDNDGLPSLWDMIRAGFAKAIPSEKRTNISEDTIAIEDLEEKQVAYYAGLNSNPEVMETIANAGISSVDITRVHKLSGASILSTNKNLALTKAGTTLLEAFDAGAEVLIVENEATYTMFSSYFDEIESVIGRKMIGLELISARDFLSQLESVKA
jgi:succinate dehydrogenase/fumarate reductase-like Fe-S protein